MPRFKAEKHKHLSVDEVQLLLNGPRMAGRERDYYLLSLAYYLALRGGEAVALKPEHINLSNVEAYIPSEKRKPRKGQPVCPDTGRPLIQIPILFGDSVIAGAVQWAQRNPSPRGLMFPSRVNPEKPISTRQFRLTFRLWARAAGLPPEVSAHSLRHSAGTHVYASAGAKIRASGADPLILIRDFMRHANAATTSIYLHSSPDTIHAARKAMGG